MGLGKVCLLDKPGVVRVMFFFLEVSLVVSVHGKCSGERMSEGRNKLVCRFTAAKANTPSWIVFAGQFRAIKVEVTVCARWARKAAVTRFATGDIHIQVVPDPVALPELSAAPKPKHTRESVTYVLRVCQNGYCQKHSVHTGTL